MTENGLSAYVPTFSKAGIRRIGGGAQPPASMLCFIPGNELHQALFRPILWTDGAARGDGYALARTVRGSTTREYLKAANLSIISACDAYPRHQKLDMRRAIELANAIVKAVTSAARLRPTSRKRSPRVRDVQADLARHKAGRKHSCPGPVQHLS